MVHRREAKGLAVLLDIDGDPSGGHNFVCRDERGERLGHRTQQGPLEFPCTILKAGPVTKQELLGSFGIANPEGSRAEPPVDMLLQVGELDLENRGKHVIAQRTECQN